MFKVAAILTLCALLDHMGVCADPVVKMKVCRNVFKEVFSKGLEELGSSVNNDMIKDLVTRKKWTGNQGLSKRHGKERKPTTFQIKMASFINTNVQSIKDNTIDMTTQIRIKFEGNSQEKSRREVFDVNADLSTAFSIKKENGKLRFVLKKCELFIRGIENSWFQSSGELKLMTGKHEGILKSKLCNIVRKMSKTMDDSVTSLLNNGIQSWIVTTIESSNLDCVEIGLSRDSERGIDVESRSEPIHNYFSGNGISVLKYYINKGLSKDPAILDKILASMNLQLTPDELQTLIPGARKTDAVSLQVTIQKPPQMTMDSGNAKITVSAEVTGFASGSTEPIFTLSFDALLDADLSIKGNRLIFHVFCKGFRFTSLTGTY
ncbi:uncharacterized protein O3C94_020284 [Discoglossus pictus]